MVRYTDGALDPSPYFRSVSSHQYVALSPGLSSLLCKMKYMSQQTSCVLQYYFSVTLYCDWELIISSFSHSLVYLHNPRTACLHN